ncbi:peptidyl-prolyl cis-trans isomerase E isoform X2 [Poeciliopsis prolifica]|uniref:peptidyl-prolyl cis-trans isomerase E isoform X2 n=1 Tax=Poeciliopsis prolifica TaxID=188132 RepID=UPI0024132928|nr:peptidyl-prolyl cis-trans isomerase E isoform X2 [Poeciliopsis prolifica]
MAASKRVLYVGGLAEEVDEKVLHAAFIPFGDIIDIQIPLDYETEKHRGFAFIEFELAEDAAAAIDNMNESELFGRTIRVNIAKPMRIKEGSSRPVWSDDDWLKKFSGKTVEEAEAEAASGETTTTTQEGEPPAKKGRVNPQVYMDIKIGNKPAGRLRFLLRADIVPMTRTSAACAHMKRGLATKAAASIALSLSSCAKEETSPTTTAPAGNPSTAESLMTRTLSSSTQLQGNSPWPTLGQTQTALSSSSPQIKRTGWMGNMLCSAIWWREWMCCVQWKLRERRMANQNKK